MDPLSFESSTSVGDWVAGKEMYMENNEYADWTSLDPPSVDLKLLELSVDEAEYLRTGKYKSSFTIFFFFFQNLSNMLFFLG